MYSLYLILLILFVSTVTTILFKHKKKYAIRFLVSVVVVVLMSFLYFSNNSFRLYIRSNFLTSHYHEVYNDGTVEKFPLPPNTGFNFRTSDHSANYYSKLSKEELLEFYKKNSNFVINSNEGLTDFIKIKYKNSFYKIKLKEKGHSGTFMYIEVVNENN